MKNIISLVLSAILGVGLCFSQEVVPSKIKEVTLFTNQALIKREASLRVKKGLNELFLEIEAFSLDRDSVSAKVYGEGSLYSVQFKEIYLKEAPQKKIRELQEKIEELKEKKKSLVNQLSILGKQERFLDSVVDFSQTQIPRDLKTTFPKVDDLEKILGFLERNLQSINQAREGFNKEIKELDEEIEVLEKELATLKRPHQETKKVIEIVFDSKKDQPVKIEADYLVYNSRWQPLYKIDVPLNLGEIKLVMFSKIRQKTGEDWKNIKLSISNVIPLRGVGLPTLSSWFLDVKKRVKRHRPGVDMFVVQKGRRKAITFEEKEGAGLANFVYAIKKELPLSFEYQLPQTLTIESKDKDTLLPLFSKTLKGEFFYYVVPKVSPLTFLVCKTSSDKELLSGPLNVYFGGRFIGKTHLAEKKPGEEFYLNLGADREIKVKREKVKDKIKETFFGKIERKTVIRELAFKITVENLKEKPLKLKLLDSIPISRTDRIEVKNVKLTPEPKEKNYQDKEGVNLWEFDIQSKEKVEINIEFIVTYPKDIPIYGL
ncbi:MAG: mucoidy inhibitor MuiA family protein [Candidatus Omnitrophica bacterium]|nr:mucoidy inhibitor MuiA family protein [Candidatus Omnitrophota bacterium]